MKIGSLQSLVCVGLGAVLGLSVAATGDRTSASRADRFQTRPLRRQIARGRRR